MQAWAPQLVTPVSVQADHVTLRGVSVLHAAVDMSGFFAGDCDGQVSTRILGRRTRLFHLSLFLTASRMGLPKILVLTARTFAIASAALKARGWRHRC